MLHDADSQFLRVEWNIRNTSAAKSVEHFVHLPFVYAPEQAWLQVEQHLLAKRSLLKIFLLLYLTSIWQGRA